MQGDRNVCRINYLHIGMMKKSRGNAVLNLSELANQVGELRVCRDD